jgi:four helix bundle protein
LKLEIWGLTMSEYIELKDLNAYKYARQYSRLAWPVYENFDWKMQKIIGYQTIQSIDSVGANIAEGYGRFHYLDKTNFITMHEGH